MKWVVPHRFCWLKKTWANVALTCQVAVEWVVDGLKVDLVFSINLLKFVCFALN